MKKPSREKKIQPPKTTTATSPKKAVSFERWLPFIVAVFGFLLYINTIHHNYVLDDEMVMAKNTQVKEGISAIPKIMTSAYRAGFWDRKEGLYRPLSKAMFAVEWQFFPDNPLPAHLINILLYALSGFLLYYLLRGWFRDRHPLIAFWIALLFISHPLHTEVVANIKSRDEILGLLFGILAMQQFLNFAQNQQLKNIFTGCFCFLLSVLAKESYITLFLGIPLSVYFFSRLQAKKYVKVFGSLAVVVIIYLSLRYYSLGELIAFNQIKLINNSMVAATTFSQRFATAVVYVGVYFKLFLFPHPLSFDYSYNSIPVANLSDARFLLSFLLILGMAVFSFMRFRKRSPIAFGILFFGITISIVTNLVVLIESTLAERFMYLPSLGLSIASVLLIAQLFKVRETGKNTLGEWFGANKTFAVLLVLVLSLFSIKTISRNRDWKSSLDLFTADIQNNPKSGRVHYSYASKMYDTYIDKKPTSDSVQRKKIIEDIILHLNTSLDILPENEVAWYLLGVNLLEVNKVDEARAAEENSLKMDTTFANAWYILGNCYAKQNNFNAALSDYQKALQFDPNLVEAHNNLGNCYGVLQQFDKSLEQYKKVLDLDPNQRDALRNIAITYNILGQPQQAEIYSKRLSDLDK